MRAILKWAASSSEARKAIRMPRVTRLRSRRLMPVARPQPAEHALHADVHQFGREAACAEVDVPVGQHARQHLPEDLQTLVT